MDQFRIFIERLLSHEGGYVNDPRDPGGETQWGISKRSYPSVNIKALTREGAIEIYRRDFWERSRADDLSSAWKAGCCRAAAKRSHQAVRSIMGRPLACGAAARSPGRPCAASSPTARRAAGPFLPGWGAPGVRARTAC